MKRIKIAGLITAGTIASMLFGCDKPGWKTRDPERAACISVAFSEGAEILPTAIEEVRQAREHKTIELSNLSATLRIVELAHNLKNCF